LSIVKEIVVGHGWEISLIEGEDGGARFEIDNIVFQPAVYN
jgi:signal transduction histidine kinase